MTLARVDDLALYRCTVCDEEWTYEAVQHVARCRACGGGLRHEVVVAAGAGAGASCPLPGRGARSEGRSVAVGRVLN
ncbi:MAG: hypothetical protein M3065_16175 [Actinomycetota bacterium]|nr:hypothetical protein [Actinomycetota bacterium]